MPQQPNFSGLPDQYDFSKLPDPPQSSFDWWAEQALRTTPAVIGGIGGGLLGNIPGGMAGGAAGAALGDVLGNWYTGKEFNPYEFGVTTALGGIPPVLGPAKFAGQGLGAIAKYAGKTALRGGLEGGIIGAGSVPIQRWAQGGDPFDTSAEEFLQGAGAGALLGGTIGGGMGAYHGTGLNKIASLPPRPKVDILPVGTNEAPPLPRRPPSDVPPGWLPFENIPQDRPPAETGFWPNTDVNLPFGEPEQMGLPLGAYRGTSGRFTKTGPGLPARVRPFVDTPFQQMFDESQFNLGDVDPWSMRPLDIQSPTRTQPGSARLLTGTIEPPNTQVPVVGKSVDTTPPVVTSKGLASKTPEGAVPFKEDEPFTVPTKEVTVPLIDALESEGFTRTKNPDGTTTFFKKLLKNEEGSSDWANWLTEWVYKRIQQRTGKKPDLSEVGNEVEYVKSRYAPYLKEWGDIPVIPDYSEAKMMDAATASSFIDDTTNAVQYWKKRFNEFAADNDQVGVEIANKNMMQAAEVLQELKKGELDLSDMPGPEDPRWTNDKPPKSSLMNSDYAYDKAKGLLNDGFVADANKTISDEVELLNQSGMHREAAYLADNWDKLKKDFFAPETEFGTPNEEGQLPNPPGMSPDDIHADLTNQPFMSRPDLPDIPNPNNIPGINRANVDHPHISPDAQSLIRNSDTSKLQETYIELSKDSAKAKFEGDQNTYHQLEDILAQIELELGNRGHDIPPRGFHESEPYQGPNLRRDEFPHPKDMMESRQFEIERRYQNTGRALDKYRLPDGSVIPVDATATKGVQTTDFQMRDGSMVKMEYVGPLAPEDVIDPNTGRVIQINYPEGPSEINDEGLPPSGSDIEGIRQRNVLGQGGAIPGEQMLGPRGIADINIDQPTPMELGQQELPLGPHTELMPRELMSDMGIGHDYSEPSARPIESETIQPYLPEVGDSIIRNYLGNEDVITPEMRDLRSGQVPRRRWSEELKRFIEDESGSTGDLLKLKSIVKGLFRDKEPGRYERHKLTPEEANIRTDVSRGLEWPNMLVDKLAGKGPIGDLYGQRVGQVPADDNLSIRRALEAKLESLPEDGTYAPDSKRGRAITNHKKTLIDLINKLITDETGSLDLGSISRTGKDIKSGIQNLFKRGPNDEPSTAEQIISTPTNLTTTGDLSGAGRQGLPQVFTPEFRRAVGPMIRAFNNPEYAKAVNAELKQLPVFIRYRDMHTGKIIPSIADKAGMKPIEGTDVSGSEMGVSSTWAETGAPLGPLAPAYKFTVGRYFKASNRAYATFLNHLRMNSFQNLMDDARAIAVEAIETGSARPGLLRQNFTPEAARDLDPYTNGVRAKEIADYVNTATGRGPLKGYVIPVEGTEVNLEFAAKALRWGMFAPRLVASRMRMLNPNTYVMASPFVRKQYLKSALGLAAAWGGVNALAKMAGDAGIADIETNGDTNSADFGKIRIGNTRLDPGGGFQQFLVAYSRMISGHVTSSRTGRDTELGQGYRAPTRLDVLQQFGSNKLNPVVKFGYDLLGASEQIPFHVADRTAQLFVPLIWQDLREITREDPSLLPMMIPAIGGMGLQTYEKGESVGKIVPTENDWLFTGGELWGSEP